MKCPKCRKKMIFNREIKDYYCTSCKSSLEDLLDEDENEEEEQKEKFTAKKTQKDDESVPVTPPEVGTIKGLLFMMLGSLLFLIGPFIIFCKDILEMIGFFLIIIGFFLVYKDRNNYSKEHTRNIKFASIILVIWIVLMIITFFISITIQINFSNEINNLEDDDFIPRSISEDYVENFTYVIMLSPLIITLFTITRVLTIMKLIQPNLKIILVLVIPMLIVSGFMGMYFALDRADQLPDIYEETTKDELFNEPQNVTSKIDQDNNFLIITNFLVVTGHAVMVLCYYWTYTYQRNLTRKERNIE